MYKIYLAINGETNDLVGLGSCVVSNAYGDIPARAWFLSASTIKGSSLANSSFAISAAKCRRTDQFARRCLRASGAVAEPYQSIVRQIPLDGAVVATDPPVKALDTFASSNRHGSA